MIKRRCMLFLVLVLLLFISGCETVKGAAMGAAAGVKKDWESIKNADAKLREILW